MAILSLISSCIVSISIIISVFAIYISVCKDDKCSNLAKLGEWRLDSESDISANLVKDCSNNIPYIDGCKKINSNLKNISIKWSDISCNKVCGNDRKGKKKVIFENNTFESKNDYSCENVDCNTLVTKGLWNKSQENINNLTITRTCTNNNPSIDACSLINNSELNKTINWDISGNCSEPCNGGTFNKYLIYDGQTFTSNPLTCNTETCNSMANLFDWTLNSRNDISVNIIRTCTNKDISRNACSKISQSQTINWDINGDGNCSEPCNGGTYTKSVTYDGKTFTSTPLTCNTETCSSMVNLLQWTAINNNDSTININRTCTNKVTNRDACSKIPLTDTSKTFIWSNITTCSRPCNGGKKYFIQDGETFESPNINCNTESCSDLVYYSWSSNNGIDLNINCFNRISTRNACSLQNHVIENDRLLNRRIQNKYPPDSVRAGVSTATINGITYTFTNDGANGQNAAYNFDKLNSNTWYDGKGGYNVTTGLYDGTASTTNNVRGAWFQIQLSTQINVNGYYIVTTSPFSEWYLFGSNNGSSWTQLDYKNQPLAINDNGWLTPANINQPMPNNIGTYFVFNNNNTYTHYRFVISKSALQQNGRYNTNPNILEFYLFTLNTLNIL